MATCLYMAHNSCSFYFPDEKKLHFSFLLIWSIHRGHVESTLWVWYRMDIAIKQSLTSLTGLINWKVANHSLWKLCPDHYSKPFKRWYADINNFQKKYLCHFVDFNFIFRQDSCNLMTVVAELHGEKCSHRYQSIKIINWHINLHQPQFKSNGEKCLPYKASIFHKCWWYDWFQSNKNVTTPSFHTF